MPAISIGSNRETRLTTTSLPASPSAASTEQTPPNYQPYPLETTEKCRSNKIAPVKQTSFLPPVIPTRESRKIRQMSGTNLLQDVLDLTYPKLITDDLTYSLLEKTVKDVKQQNHAFSQQCLLGKSGVYHASRISDLK